MASIFMAIEGMNPEGCATVEGLDGGEGWFALDGFSWGGIRNVEMDIGNARNQDTGMVAVSGLNVTKQMDGAQAGLLSFLYSPGVGREVKIAVMKTGASTDGPIVYFQVKLAQARLTSYQISCSDGQKPYESMEFSYNEVTQIYNWEAESGDITPGDPVIFNIPMGKMLSGETSSL